ncbi:MAG: YabP/YqfC family sporulation protein [Ruminococcus sp.]
MSGKRVRKILRKRGIHPEVPTLSGKNILTAMQVPGDLACKDPIITLTGPSRAVIENYKSILFYSGEKLIILTCKGK